MRQSGPRRVLIVESDGGVARTLDLLFDRSECACKVAASGEEAIAVASAWTPDAVVIEAVLASMMGLDAARILRERHPGCRVVLLMPRLRPRS